MRTYYWFLFLRAQVSISIYVTPGSHLHDWAADQSEEMAKKKLDDGEWKVVEVHVPYGQAIVFDLLLRHCGDGLWPYPLVKSADDSLRTQGKAGCMRAFLNCLLLLHACICCRSRCSPATRSLDNYGRLL